MDSHRGYQIVGHVFLFKDESGKPHHGEIDTVSGLTVRPVTFANRLPSALHARFFEGPTASVPGGKIDGSAWVIAAPDPVYEFRFASARGSGFGRISKSGNSRSAYHLRRSPTDSMFTAERSEAVGQKTTSEIPNAVSCSL